MAVEFFVNFVPDLKPRRQGGYRATIVPIGIRNALSAEQAAFVVGAIDRKRNVIKPALRRQAITFMRGLLLDPLCGADIHRVWPSLQPGPISKDPQDYIEDGVELSAGLVKFVPDPEKPANGGNWARYVKPDSWLHGVFPFHKFVKDKRKREENESHIKFIEKAMDLKKNIIKPTCRKQAIALLRMLKLDPMNGADIHRVWPSLREGPISDDPADYEVD